MKKLSHYLFLFFLSANAYADTKLSPAWSSSAEFKNPESVIYDPVTKHLFVSNVNGEPLAADGNGFISQMSPEGVMAKSKWLVGLDAPKGLALKGNLLYVSDIDQLVVIDIEQERIIKRYAAENAKFLNDVAVDHQGNVYVSDMLTNRIYRLANDELTVWVDDDMLNSPNGLLVEHGKLVVASWGKMTDGFATDVPGHLLAIDLVTKQLQDLGDGKPVGNLDGIEADGLGNYLVTDWYNGRLLQITAEGKSTTLVEFNQGSADHTVMPEKNLVIVPLMLDNTVVAFRISH